MIMTKLERLAHKAKHKLNAKCQKDSDKVQKLEQKHMSIMMIQTIIRVK